jgi:hypothetical protein
LSRRHQFDRFHGDTFPQELVRVGRSQIEPNRWRSLDHPHNLTGTNAARDQQDHTLIRQGAENEIGCLRETEKRKRKQKEEESH